MRELHQKQRQGLRISHLAPFADSSCGNTNGEEWGQDDYQVDVHGKHEHGRGNCNLTN